MSIEDRQRLMTLEAKIEQLSRRVDELEAGARNQAHADERDPQGRSILSLKRARSGNG